MKQIYTRRWKQKTRQGGGNVVARLKTACTLLTGLPLGPTRLPIKPLTEDVTRTLRKDLETHGFKSSYRPPSPPLFTDPLHRPPSPTPFTDPLHRPPSPTPFTDPLHRPPSPPPFTDPLHRPPSPNYRWSESGSKVCQMCDMSEDETVEHVILECEKYSGERMEMMRVVLTEMGGDMNEVVERTGREWMLLLLGRCVETSGRMIETVKEFLERMWYMRNRQ
ncbi:hypothetical protein GWK47_040581 [Chionoecetes opilio]|uniref:Uncharacterized protein n=1 Tax=Chionoecetes opilio TaxID=41210 RepID=A0A8J5D0U6_CHIOP|nr:hypothetical protein GWK47_040581 [Chionoecetes opilio]